MTVKKFYTMFDICHFVSVLDNLTRPVVTYKYYISQKWPWSYHDVSFKIITLILSFFEVYAIEVDEALNQTRLY